MNLLSKHKYSNNLLIIDMNNFESVQTVFKLDSHIRFVTIVDTKELLIESKSNEGNTSY